MKILIVDDDLVSRSKMEVLMGAFGERILAQDGLEGISEFRHAWDADAPFDLITLDIDMPGLNGEQVLSQIREFETRQAVSPDKQAVIFMVTGLSEKDQVIKCLSKGCQDYIVKPFNIRVIREKLQKFGLLSKCSGEGSGESPPQTAPQPATPKTLFEQILDKLKAGKLNLPSFPSIPMKFRRLMKQGAPSSTIADLLKQDIAISSKLIRMSNSVFYRGRQLNNTIEGAIGRLGLAATEQLVNVLCSRTMFKFRREQYRRRFETLWTHSLGCAYAAEIVAAHKGYDFWDEAFNMGLFHDIGRLGLLQIISDLAEDAYYHEKIDSRSIEETLDLHHAKFGAGILNKWGFHQEYAVIAELHHDPQSALGADSALLVVHLANFIALLAGYGSSGEDEPTDVEIVESASVLEIAEPTLHEIQLQVRKKMHAMVKGLA
jgi:HD-like signal output (HDOD) protein/ActR/RegA family two-component response regulator